MSRFVDYNPIHIDEIDYSKCKWLINEVCCNGDCDKVGDYPYYDSCKSKEDCKWFEKEEQ